MVSIYQHHFKATGFFVSPGCGLMEVPQAGGPRESENGFQVRALAGDRVEQPTGRDGDWPDWRFQQAGIWNASTFCST